MTQVTDKDVMLSSKFFIMQNNPVLIKTHLIVLYCIALHCIVMNGKQAHLL